MKLSIGPFSIHALPTGKVVENANGTMDIYVRSREGGLTGTLFLTSDDVVTLKELRVRRIDTKDSRTEDVRHAFGPDSGPRNQKRNT